MLVVAVQAVGAWPGSINERLQSPKHTAIQSQPPNQRQRVTPSPFGNLAPAVTPSRLPDRRPLTHCVPRLPPSLVLIHIQHQQYSDSRTFPLGDIGIHDLCIHASVVPHKPWAADLSSFNLKITPLATTRPGHRRFSTSHLMSTSTGNSESILELHPCSSFPLKGNKSFQPGAEARSLHP